MDKFDFLERMFVEATLLVNGKEQHVAAAARRDGAQFVLNKFRESTNQNKVGIDIADQITYTIEGALSTLFVLSVYEKNQKELINLVSEHAIEGAKALDAALCMAAIVGPEMFLENMVKRKKVADA
jgi:hypothetical protein